ncbi:MAG TPA: histidinol dehydrogenase [Victivallales bacterium]|nr:histidinol dehydrogenase [Victivallales bacterium]
MKFLDVRNGAGRGQLEKLFQRKVYTQEIEDSVAKILNEIRKNGDSAVSKFAGKFDHVRIKPADFKIKDSEFDMAEKFVPSSLQKHIRFAVKNVKQFAMRQIPKSWIFSPRKGVTMGEKFTPMDRVGVYIPGGAAPLVSTAIHTAAVAKIAGVKEIVAVTPPSKAGINPALLFAMKTAGVTEAYRLGGVYAIAALAYGTKTVKRVEKIVGPGNAYVTAAKKLVYGTTGIDMAAGPSEIMIIADSTADPSFIAADLLSQAEHGSGYEQAVLLSTDIKIAKIAADEVINRARDLKMSESFKNVLSKGIFVVVVKDLESAAEIAGQYAPEHLEILCKNPDNLAKKLSSAGAIFIGHWTPEAAGDYVAGPSHVLPTGSTARFFSGLSAEHFFRRSSIIKYSESALRREASAIIAIADTEGLRAHKLSVAVRCGRA